MAAKMNITSCTQLLTEARKAFDEVKARADAVGRELTAATNALNEAQKTFDAAVEDVKADAPWNSDWHSQRQRNTGARA